MSWTGGCQCGAVRYRLDAEPARSNVCHCRMCQKAAGAPFMTFAGVTMSNFVWTRGTPKTFASSDIAERGFCAECGTPLSYFIPGRDWISVTIGSFDRAADVPPAMQYGVESKLPWADAISSLPIRDFTAAIEGRAVRSRQHPDHET
jgi:hypothetical protein